MIEPIITTIECSTCGGQSVFDAAASACPHCGGNLAEQALTSCKNCAMKFNPYHTEHCPSCYLGIDEIICDNCGTFYAPFDKSGNEVPCPGCRYIPDIEFEDSSSSSSSSSYDEEQGDTSSSGPGLSMEAEPETMRFDCYGFVEGEDERENQVVLNVNSVPYLPMWFVVKPAEDSDCSWVSLSNTRIYLNEWYSPIIRAVVDQHWELEDREARFNVYEQYYDWELEEWVTEEEAAASFSVFQSAWDFQNTELHTYTPFPEETDFPLPDSSSSSSSSFSSSSSYMEPAPPSETTEKPENCPCDQKEGAGSTGTGLGSVDFTISFGRIPSLPELGVGALSLFEGMMSEDMTWRDALEFRHVTQRVIETMDEIYDYRTEMSGMGASQKGDYIRLKTERGYHRFSSFDSTSEYGQKLRGSFIHREQVRKITADGEPYMGPASGLLYYEETLEDGKRIIYRHNPNFETKVPNMKQYVFSHLILPDGRTIDSETIGKELDVVKEPNPRLAELHDYKNWSEGTPYYPRINDMIIRQVWNRVDGLLSVEEGGISWYAPHQVQGKDSTTGLYTVKPGEEPVKRWDISSSLGMYVLPWGDRWESVKEPYQLAELYHDLDTMHNPRPGVPYLEIVEKRGDLRFRSTWSQTKLNQIVFTKGEGDEAISITKETKWHGNIGKAPRVISRPSPDGYMMLGGEYGNTTSIEETTWSRGSGDSREVVTETYERLAFGTVLTGRSDGTGTVHYEYKKDAGRLAGRLIEEIHSDGKTVSYNYNNQGRIISRSEPWAGGGTKVTRYTWRNVRFHEYEPATETVWLVKDGEKTMLQKTCHVYEETPEYRRETVTVTGIGIDTPRVTVTEWYGSNPSTNGQDCAWAASRLKLLCQPDGTQTCYRYEDTTEFGAVYKVIAVQAADGQEVPGQSTMNVDHVNDMGRTVVSSRYLHMGARPADDAGRWYGDTDYKLVSRESYEYDYSGNVTKTTDLAGRVRQAEWICKGPLSETDENGITTTYRYNSAKDLVETERPAISWDDSGEGGTDPDPDTNKYLIVDKNQYLTAEERETGRNNLGISGEIQNAVSSHDTSSDAHAGLFDLKLDKNAVGRGLALDGNGHVNVDWSLLPAATSTAIGGVRPGTGLVVGAGGTLGVSADVFRTDQTVVVTGNTSFTQPLSIADGASSGHAINRSQAYPVSAFGSIIDGLGMTGVQTWRIDEDYMYKDMSKPAELLYFVRGRDYVVNVAGPSFNAAVPASRLALRCSSMSTMVNPYVLPSVMIVPFQSNYYNRNSWQVGISLNAAPVTSTPSNLDGYPFVGNWTDGNKPTRFWCDIQLPFATLTPRIRVMATPAGSASGTAPVLDTRGLSLPSLVKPCAFIVAIASGRASILMLNHDAKLYRLYDFSSGIALSAEPTLYLSAYTYKDNTDGWAQTWHQIGAPRITYNTKLADELIDASTKTYIEQ